MGGERQLIMYDAAKKSSLVCFPVDSYVKLFFQVKDKNCSIGSRCSNFVTAAVPANLKDSSGTFVWVYLEKIV